MLRAVVVVPEAHVVDDLVWDRVEGLVGAAVDVHDGGRGVFEVAAVGLRVEGHVL